MKIKAIGFDIGGTLVNYNKSLNWSVLYDDAITYACEKNSIILTEKKINDAKMILEKYNTRVTPREVEVPGQVIFKEIFDKWNENKEKLTNTKKAFYEFFQKEAILYDDVIEVLDFCKDNGIKCSVFTDIAYGMEDEISLNDISEIADYIDLKLTSLNVGYRKPNKKGFELMLEKFNCRPDEMFFVGDEQKDIQGAKSVNMKSILICRDGQNKKFNQDYTVTKLTEIINIVRSM